MLAFIFSVSRVPIINRGNDIKLLWLFRWGTLWLRYSQQIFHNIIIFGRISYCPVARLALCFESHLRIKNGQVLPAEFHKIIQIHQNANFPSYAIFKKTVLSMLLALQEIALQICHPYFSNHLKVNQTQMPCPKSLTCKHQNHRPSMSGQVTCILKNTRGEI